MLFLERRLKCARVLNYRKDGALGLLGRDAALVLPTNLPVLTLVILDDLIDRGANNSPVGMLARAGSRHVMDACEVPWDTGVMEIIRSLLDQACSVSGGAFNPNDAGTFQTYLSVYGSPPAIAASKAFLAKATGSAAVAAVLSHLDSHPHGIGGPHPLPDGVAHSGYQVDATRGEHLITMLVRLAVTDTPFGWELPGGETHVLGLPPWTISLITVRVLASWQPPSPSWQPFSPTSTCPASLCISAG
jgi:hypothetical protein